MADQRYTYRVTKTAPDGIGDWIDGNLAADGITFTKLFDRIYTDYIVPIESGMDISSVSAALAESKTAAQEEPAASRQELSATPSIDLSEVLARLDRIEEMLSAAQASPAQAEQAAADASCDFAQLAKALDQRNQIYHSTTMSKIEEHDQNICELLDALREGLCAKAEYIAGETVDEISQALMRTADSLSTCQPQSEDAGFASAPVITPGGGFIDPDMQYDEDELFDSIDDENDEPQENECEQFEEPESEIELNECEFDFLAMVFGDAKDEAQRSASETKAETEQDGAGVSEGDLDISDDEISDLVDIADEDISATKMKDLEPSDSTDDDDPLADIYAAFLS